VLVAGVAVTKAGTLVPEEAEVVLKGPPSPYVSRGGEKLAPALEHFQVSPAGKVALDAQGHPEERPFPPGTPRPTQESGLGDL